MLDGWYLKQIYIFDFVEVIQVVQFQDLLNPNQNCVEDLRINL